MAWNPSSFPGQQWPFPPANCDVFSPLFRGALDIRWDDPAVLGSNTPWPVVGVNVYRSDVGDRGPYHRLNVYPLGGTFYRDFTDNFVVSNEVVPWDSGWIFRGDSPNAREWRLRTRFRAVKPQFRDRVVYASSPSDVRVTIDGRVADVHSVFGELGEITLVNTGHFDPVTETLVRPPLPSPTSSVLVTYTANQNVVGYELDRKVSYRVTTVAEHPDLPGGLVETPLQYCQPLSPYKLESLDYMWREAVRRNNWILEQGGERAKLFVRKTAGVRCDCSWDSRRMVYSKQHKTSCSYCFGTGFLGGYEGPYEVIVAPDDGERSVRQTNWGRSVQHNYEVFMGPTPMVTQRDFLVRQSNERYSIGPVRRPTNRGNVLQQHFSIGRLDEGDVRYEIPLDGLADLPWPQTRTVVPPSEISLVYPLAEFGPMAYADVSEHGPQVYPDSPGSVHPLSTQKDTADDSLEHRGRTATWENHNY